MKKQPHQVCAVQGGRSYALLALCVLPAALTWAWVPAAGATRTALVLFVFIAALWMTQAIHVAATALLVPLLAVAARIQPPAEALAPFAHPIIFLFLGGFALAAALQKHGLAAAFAAGVLRLARGRKGVAVVLLAAATALLSLWMSNTAAAVLMLPLALGLIAADPDTMGPKEQSFTLLAMTYSTALGGMASIVSTPPNAMAAAHAGAGFGEWFTLVAPLSLTLWVLMVAVLYLTLRPRLGGAVVMQRPAFAWTQPRLATLAIFAAAVAGWVGGPSLGALLGVPADMHAVVAIAAVLALVGSGTLPWKEFEGEVQWGVLILFGGGLALSEVMAVSGASAFLVQRLLAVLQGAPAVLVILGVVAFVLLLSELMSNTASAALALPLFMPLAQPLGLSPTAMAAAIALAASCGFMLPVATPPNALVFGTGRVTQATMVRCGWKLDLVCIAAITVAARWFWS